MKLLLDIGNSRTKFSFFNKGKLSDVLRVNNGDIDQNWSESTLVGISEMVIASVSNEKLTEFITRFATEKSIPITLLSSEDFNGYLNTDYKNPHQLGTDRWLALSGAYHVYPSKNILIIDTGTATTIDWLDDTQHKGGWILPGIDLMFSSLMENTEKISANQSKISILAFGDNSSACINNACWAATVGLVEQAIKQASKNTVIDHVLITGGNGALLNQLLENKYQFIDELLFFGIKEYLQRRQ
jgi:type III pantothenate kinase